MARRIKSSRRRTARGGSEGWKIALGVVSGLVALAGFGSFFYFKNTSEKPTVRDQASLCPISGPQSLQVILLDATDDLPSPARKEIATLLSDAVSSAPPNELVEVRLLDPSTAGGRTIFSRCNPGDGSDLSALTANPALARKKWVESFQMPLQAALASGLRPSHANFSPILATLQTIALERFTGRVAQSLPKRLLVLSDLIEHGPKYSQYGGRVTYADFRKSDLYKDVRTNLNGAEVSFYQVQRRTRNAINSAGLIQFWIDWVSDNNGRFKEALKLQGLG